MLRMLSHFTSTIRVKRSLSAFFVICVTVSVFLAALVEVPREISLHIVLGVLFRMKDYAMFISAY